MMNHKLSLLGLSIFLVAAQNLVAADEGVFVRFRLVQPAGAKFYVKLGGFIHQPNWYLPATDIPAGAEKTERARIDAGQFTDWFDLKAFAGTNLHGRLNLAGGIAEFPNITARFVTEPASGRRDVEIELATAPDAAKVVKRWQESFAGDTTSFLVSPTLAADAAQLESASEMTERRLRWAREATGGTRHAPKKLLIQTSFWSPQREELNLKEAKVLSLLGFNIVGGMSKEVRAQFPEFRAPGASHDVLLGPESDREAVRATWDKLAPQFKDLQPGAPFNFQDEICARPALGPNFTWEGFQLMGFQAAMFRSASRGEIPIIAWITPSDERNLNKADPCIRADAAQSIGRWVKEGGTLVATCAAGSRNEFGESTAELAKVYGIGPELTADCQTGAYRMRGRLNHIPHRDRMKFAETEFGVIGVKTSIQPRAAKTKATFTSDVTPALLENRFGRGRAFYFAATPGISYIKDAKFVAEALAEKWPVEQRRALTRFALDAKAAPLVKLAESVVEAGLYDAPAGTALILANFTYNPIQSLQIEVPTRNAVTAVKSLANGVVAFKTLPAISPWKEEGYKYVQRFAMPLGLDDIVILETR